MKRIIPAIAAFVCFLGLTAQTFSPIIIPPPHVPTYGARNVEIGVGGHPFVSGSIENLLTDDTLIRTVNQAGFTRYRVDIAVTDDALTANTARLTSMLAAANKYKVQLEPVLIFPFAFGDRTDNGRYPAGDSTALYNQGLNKTLNFVSQFKSIVDWSFENELNLLVTNLGSPLFGMGWTATEFNTTLMNDWASVLKGASDAIDMINSTLAGTKLRRGYGTTSTMFGFIDFMLSKNVKLDFLVYHYYEHLGVDPANYWGGVLPNFNLFTKLSTYGVQVYVDEFNCAETYDSGFTDVPGSTLLATCMTNLTAMLAAFTSQTIVNIGYIGFYELFDEPSKSPSDGHTGAEGQFGVFYAPPKNIIGIIGALKK